MTGIIRLLFVIQQCAEHSIAVAQMVAIDCDILTWLLIVRTLEGEQGAELAFLAGKQMLQIVLLKKRSDLLIKMDIHWSR